MRPSRRPTAAASRPGSVRRMRAHRGGLGATERCCPQAVVGPQLRPRPSPSHPGSTPDAPDRTRAHPDVPGRTQAYPIAPGTDQACPRPYPARPGTSLSLGRCRASSGDDLGGTAGRGGGALVRAGRLDGAVVPSETSTAVLRRSKGRARPTPHRRPCSAPTSPLSAALGTGRGLRTEPAHAPAAAGQRPDLPVQRQPTEHQPLRSPTYPRSHPRPHPSPTRYPQGSAVPTHCPPVRPHPAPAIPIHTHATPGRTHNTPGRYLEPPAWIQPSARPPSATPRSARRSPRPRRTPTAHHPPRTQAPPHRPTS